MSIIPPVVRRLKLPASEMQVISKISTELFRNIPPSSACISNIYYFSVCMNESPINR